MNRLEILKRFNEQTSIIITALADLENLVQDMAMPLPAKEPTHGTKNPNAVGKMFAEGTRSDWIFKMYYGRKWRSIEDQFEAYKAAFPKTVTRRETTEKSLRDMINTMRYEIRRRELPYKFAAFGGKYRIEDIKDGS